MLMPKYEARPRLWVRSILNPFFHKKGKHSVIRHSARMDVVPFNQFMLGNHSFVEDFSTINNGVGNVIIGDHSIVGLGTVIIGPVTIGNHVLMAQHIVASGLNHGYDDVSLPISQQPVTTSPIIIEDECWIGANAVITSGVIIGKHSVVAGGAVVTKNVPPFSVVAGNPARVIKQYDFDRKEWTRVTQI